jgi:putative spermidine/putrescine transport system permease protein
MADVTQRIAQEGGVTLPRRGGWFLARGGRSLAWLGVIPFFLYVAVFLLLPTLWLILGAFQTDAGGFTLAHVQELFQAQYGRAFLYSVELSVVTALSGGVFGFFVAFAMVKEGAPRWLRPTLTTFAGVATNFAGIPLAFAFVATLGLSGVLTTFLAAHGIDLYAGGFTLYSFTGLALAYTYFQLPLMILIISPSLDGLKRQWWEAATNMGASSWQFWRWVGLPVLWPALLGAMVLLFGNAFSAYATAYALAGSEANLVPVLIGAVLSGNVESDPQFGDVLALGMILIIAVTVLIYALLQRRSNRWLQ